MATTRHDRTKSRPNVSECHTECIVEGLSRCLANNSSCIYALPAGSTTTYCMHRDSKKFQRTLFLDPPRNPVKAITLKKG
jgi:hypothetical protein